jgi:hypothetical protein
MGSPVLLDVNQDAVYRVHWLKAKARRDRWSEESTLLSFEMDWVLNYFQTQAARWHGRATAAGGGGDNDELDLGDRTSVGVVGRGRHLSSGHRCYALRQENMWLKFSEAARLKFTKAKQQM